MCLFTEHILQFQLRAGKVNVTLDMSQVGTTGMGSRPFPFAAA